MLTIDKDKQLTRAEGLVSSEIDGEVVMMSVDQGKYFGINSVGSRIWSLLESPVSVKEMCQTFF